MSALSPAPKTVVFPLRIPVTLRDQFRAIAQAQHRTNTAQICIALAQWADAHSNSPGVLTPSNPYHINAIAPSSNNQEAI